MTVKEFLATKSNKDSILFNVLLEKEGTVLLAPCTNSDGDKFVSVIELDWELPLVSIDLEKVLSENVFELTICTLYNPSQPAQYRKADVC